MRLRKRMMKIANEGFSRDKEMDLLVGEVEKMARILKYDMKRSASGSVDENTKFYLVHYSFDFDGTPSRTVEYFDDKEEAQNFLKNLLSDNKKGTIEEHTLGEFVKNSIGEDLFLELYDGDYNQLIEDEMFYVV